MLNKVEIIDAYFSKEENARVKKSEDSYYCEFHDQPIYDP